MNSNAQDETEIRQTIALYSVALDSRDPDRLTDVFTEDAELEMAGFTTRAAWIGHLHTALPEFDATQHKLGLPLIKVDGDGAHSRTYFRAMHVKASAGEDPCFEIGGWYDDELRRLPEGWRIVKRTGVPLWGGGNPAVLNDQFPLGAIPRGPEHDLPKWAR